MNSDLLGCCNRCVDVVVFDLVTHEERFREYTTAQLPRLRRLAYLICGNHHQGDDAVQEVLVKLYASPPRDWGAVDTWVRVALTRRLIDDRRRAWNRERSTDRLPERGVADPDSVQRLDLLSALATLPGQQRTAVVLRYWDGLSVAETASLLRLPEGTVKSHCARGLATLRMHLEGADLT